MKNIKKNIKGGVQRPMNQNRTAIPSIASGQNFKDQMQEIVDNINVQRNMNFEENTNLHNFLRRRYEMNFNNNGLTAQENKNRMKEFVRRMFMRAVNQAPGNGGISRFFYNRFRDRNYDLPELPSTPESSLPGNFTPLTQSSASSVASSVRPTRTVNIPSRSTVSSAASSNASSLDLPSPPSQGVVVSVPAGVPVTISEQTPTSSAPAPAPIFRPISDPDSQVTTPRRTTRILAPRPVNTSPERVNLSNSSESSPDDDLIMSPQRIGSFEDVPILGSIEIDPRTGTPIHTSYSLKSLDRDTPSTLSLSNVDSASSIQRSSPKPISATSSIGDFNDALFIDESDEESSKGSKRSRESSRGRTPPGANRSRTSSRGRTITPPLRSSNSTPTNGRQQGGKKKKPRKTKKKVKKNNQRKTKKKVEKKKR